MSEVYVFVTAAFSFGPAHLCPGSCGTTELPSRFFMRTKLYAAVFQEFFRILPKRIGRAFRP